MPGVIRAEEKKAMAAPLFVATAHSIRDRIGMTTWIAPKWNIHRTFSRWCEHSMRRNAQPVKTMTTAGFDQRRPSGPCSALPRPLFWDPTPAAAQVPVHDDVGSRGGWTRRSTTLASCLLGDQPHPWVPRAAESLRPPIPPATIVQPPWVSRGPADLAQNSVLPEL